ncbi:MAG: hypothetical protein AB7E24_06960 [Novosphingobium sp.]
MDNTGTSPLSYAFRRLVKELIWKYLLKHNPDGNAPHVAVFSSRRGGSTMLMELLCTNSCMSFSDQPFSLYTASQAQMQELPLLEYSQIISPDDDELERIFEYTDRILSGQSVVNGPWKFWTSGSNMRTTRMVLKITDAKSIAGALAHRFGLKTVVSTRNPIAQGSSVERNGWDFTGRAFLRNPEFVERWLPGSLIDDAWSILRGNDRLACRVLDWTLENLPLIDATKSHPDWLFLSYEKLVLAPEASVRELASYCDLQGEEDRMLQQLLRPSRSTKRQSTAATREKIAEGDRTYLASRWREKIPESRERELLDICSHFGLGIYKPGLDEPVF